MHKGIEILGALALVGGGAYFYEKYVKGSVGSAPPVVPKGTTPPTPAPSTSPVVSTLSAVTSPLSSAGNAISTIVDSATGAASSITTSIPGGDGSASIPMASDDAGYAQGNSALDALSNIAPATNDTTDTGSDMLSALDSVF